MKHFAVVNTFEDVLSDWADCPSDCQSISFKNVGAVDCRINGFLIASGDAMLTLENDNVYAVDITKYSIQFDKSQTGLKKLVVIRTYHDFSKTPKPNL